MIKTLSRFMLGFFVSAMLCGILLGIFMLPLALALPLEVIFLILLYIGSSLLPHIAPPSRGLLYGALLGGLIVVGAAVWLELAGRRVHPAVLATLFGTNVLLHARKAQIERLVADWLNRSR